VQVAEFALLKFEVDVAPGTARTGNDGVVGCPPKSVVKFFGVLRPLAKEKRSGIYQTSMKAFTTWSPSNIRV
jgi:hypothetical protein